MKLKIYLYGEAAHYANYSHAILAAGGQLCCSLNPSLAEECDALLLPGGGDLAPWRYGQACRGSNPPDPKRDEMELALLDRFVALKKPVLGICRGLQVVNVYFGGTLIQDLPGHSAVGGRDRLHTVRTASGPLRVLFGAHAVFNSAHHQAVDHIGGGLQAVQWTGDGTVEALFHKSLPVYTVQWHPERLTGSLSLAGTVNGDKLFQWFLQVS